MLPHTKRYDALDGLRAYAAVGIVSMHVMTNGGFVLPDPVHHVIGSMGEFVYLFMVVSGFSMCCGYYDRMLSGNLSIVDFYKRRFAKVLPFFALLCLADLISNPSTSAMCEAFANITLCFGLLPNPTMSVVGVGWFLGLVFVFYLLFPFYCFLLANKKRAWLSFGIALVYNQLCSIFFFNNTHVVAGFDGRTNILYCAAFFILGGLLFLYKDELSDKYSAAKPFIFLFSIVIYLYMAFTHVSAPLLLLFCGALLIAAILSTSCDGLLCNKAVRRISSISLEIYLSHMAIYRLVQKGIGPLSMQKNALSFAATLCIVLAGAVLLAAGYQRALAALKGRLRHRLACNE